MKNLFSMILKILSIISFTALFTFNAYSQRKEYQVKHFEKIIVSPHVELILTEGDKESVTVNSRTIEQEKVNVKVVGNTLRIYLDKAKAYTKHQKTKYYGRKSVHPIYKGLKVTAYVTYKELKKLSVRGEESVECNSTLKADKFKLKVFGEADVEIASVETKSMKTALFGENTLRIKKGTIGKQKFIAYGENTVDSKEVIGHKAKATCFGESNLRLNVEKRIKFTSYGESELTFKGDAHVAKGIVIGENEIYKYY